MLFRSGLGGPHEGGDEPVPRVPMHVDALDGDAQLAEIKNNRDHSVVRASLAIFQAMGEYCRFSVAQAVL